MNTKLYIIFLLSFILMGSLFIYEYKNNKNIKESVKGFIHDITHDASDIGNDVVHEATDVASDAENAGKEVASDAENTGK